MIDLYLDCDGVILDTIDKALEWMILEHLDIHNSDLVHEYFVQADWNKLIEEAGILNNAIEKIKLLQSIGIYDTRILTTCVNGLEPIIKKDFFNKQLPGIDVITVPWLVRKDSVVDARNSILVDDSKTNIVNWREAGGIGLQFVKEKPNLEMMEINNLLDVPQFSGKVKKLTR